MATKKPTHREHPTGAKRPSSTVNPQQTDTQYLQWDITTMDRGGDWSWAAADPADWWEHICPARHDFQSMTWAGILGPRHHRVSVDSIAKKARERLAEIEYGDVDYLYSLALTGRKRLWGMRSGPVFRVLWWDPEHEVCPSHKKHT